MCHDIERTAELEWHSYTKGASGGCRRGGSGGGGGGGDLGGGGGVGIHHAAGD